MRSAFVLKLVGLSLAALLVAPGAGLAARHKAPAAGSDTQQQAAALLEKACKALTALTGYAVHADVTLDKVYRDGSKVQFSRGMDITVQRPGAFRVATDGDDLKALAVYDGGTFTLALPERKVYGRMNFVGDTDALLDVLSTNYGLESPLGDLLSGDPCKSLAYSAAYYVGKSTVMGAACDHLFFQDKDVDWQLWVEETTGLPRKFLITEKRLPKAPQFTAVFTGWKAQENAPQVFVFTPADGFARDDAVITGPAKAGR